MLERGINDRFLDPKLKPADWVERFEIESREIYAQREQIVKRLQLQPGERIADVGAGTGLFMQLFSAGVGAEGKVFALDISPRLIQHLQDRAKALGLSNVEVVHSEARTVTLPDQSVDVVFICDTYHHFEHHAEMMRSVHAALRPGGRLIVIDFERLPGVSRDWILGHVRAGKQGFRREIERSGFKFDEEVEVEGFEENYFLRFRQAG